MSTPRVTRLILLSIGAAVAIAMTTSCGGQPRPVGSVSPGTSPSTVSTSPTLSEGDGGPGASSPAPTSATAGKATTGGAPGLPTATTIRTNANPECKAANLKLSFGRRSAAAGSSYHALQFTNIGGTNCWIGDFPGVSYVGPGNSQQVGAPAARSGTIAAPAMLAPGQMASAIVQEGNTANFPVKDCEPAAVAGFRVYPPDDTTAMFIPFNSPGATACSSSQMPGGVQLSVQTIKAGAGTE